MPIEGEKWKAYLQPKHYLPLKLKLQMCFTLWVWHYLHGVFTVDKIIPKNICHFIVDINKSFHIFAMQFENIKNTGFGIECARKKLNVA